MGRRVALHDNFVAVQLKLLRLLEEDRWQCPLGRRIDNQRKRRYHLSRTHPHPSVFMRNDGRAYGVHPEVSVGVIKMPMRIEQMTQGSRGDSMNCGSDLLLRSRKAAIDRYIAIATVTEENIPARSFQKRHILP